MNIIIRIELLTIFPVTWMLEDLCFVLLKEFNKRSRILQVLSLLEFERERSKETTITCSLFLFHWLFCFADPQLSIQTLFLQGNTTNQLSGMSFHLRTFLIAVSAEVPQIKISQVMWQIKRGEACCNPDPWSMWPANWCHKA